MRAFVGLAILLGAGTASAQSTYSTWTHSRSIFFNTTPGGANVAGNVANVPILVKLNSANFNFGEALTGGADIRFEDPDFTPLAYQIEAWDAAGQKADVWVKVPMVDGNSSQDYIRMYWGKAGATNESNGANVFQTSNGFGGVWHLNEDGNTTAGGYADASGNGYHATGTAMTTVADTPAVAARGQYFNGSTGQIDAGTGTGLHGSTALTLEAWFYRSTTPAGNKALISRPFSSNASPFNEYLVTLNPSGYLAFHLTTGGTETIINATTAAANSAWHHVMAVYDGTSMRLYLDGVQVAVTSKSGSINDYTQAVKIGAYVHDNALRFEGILDEPRVSTAARSADWAKLSHENQRPAQTLLNFGPRIWDGGGVDDLWSNPLNWNGNVLPTAAEEVLFDGTSTDNASLDGNFGVRGLVMTSAYTGSFAFSSYTLTVTGVADLRSGGTLAAGTGTLLLNPTTSQNFHPHASATHPKVTKSGSATVLVTTNHLTSGDVEINGGTLDLATNARNLACNGNLTLTGGTLSAGSASLDVNGDVTIAGGNLNAPTGNFFIGGSLSHSSGTLAPNGGSLVFDGSGTGKTINLAAAVDNLGITGTGSWTAGSNIFVNSGFTLGAGTLDISTTARTLTAGTYTQTGGTLSANGGNVDVNGNFSHTAGAFTAPGSGKFLNVSGSFAQTGGTFTPGSGTVTFDGTGTGKTLNALTSLNAVDFTGSGEWTVTANPLLTMMLALNGSTLKLGSGLISSVTSSPTLTSGTLDFQSGTLRVDGSASFNGLSAIVAGTGTLEFMGAGAKTLTPKSAATHPRIKITGSGTVTVASFDLTCGPLDINAGGLDIGIRALTVNGNLTVAGGSLTATSGSLSVSGDAAVSSGTLDCPATTFYLGGGFTKAAGATLAHNSGSVILNGTATGKILDIASGTLYNLTVNGAGGEWTVTNSGLVLANNLSLAAGTLKLGSQLTSAGAVAGTGGTLDFGNGTLDITSGGASLSGLGTLTPASGTLRFSAGTGTQIFTPKLAASHPHIVHLGNGELELSAYDLSCLSFTNSAGSLDFGTRNITTTSGGNFTITNGGVGTLLGLGGRTITVAGSASISGTSSSNRANLNAASPCTLAVSGALTASLASLGNSHATVSSGTCTNCANVGNNIGWNVTVAWDGGAGNTSWKNAINWGSDYLPASGDDVTFNAGTQAATLDSSVTIKSITFTSGYSGAFSFGTQTLTVTGNADFRSNGTVNAASGSLVFAGSGAQAFIPKASATFPPIFQNGAGTTTVSTNMLYAGNLTLNAGTFSLGSLSASVAGVSGTGGLDLNGNSLYATGNVDLSAATVTPGSWPYLHMTGASPQTYTPNTSITTLGLTQNGAGGTTLLGGNFSVSTLTLTAGTLYLGSGRTITAITLNPSGGSLDFGSSTLRAGNTVSLNLDGLATLTAGTGTLEFTSSSALTFTPKNGVTHPSIHQNGTGGSTLSTNNLFAGALIISSGSVFLGNGRNHTVASISSTGGGLSFGTSTLNVSSGDANLAGLATLNPGTGVLAFTAPSDTQNFTPRNATTHPDIQHSGAGVLRLMTNNLSAASLSNSAGALHLNGRNVTTTGAFTVTNGTPATLAGLPGRKLTIGGNASLSGTSSASRLNLDAASPCTLAVTGTLSGSFATVGNSQATLSAGSCSNCANLGGNPGWSFSVAWDGGAGNASWKNPLNWGSDYLPAAGDDLTFGAGSQDANLDTSVTIQSITFTGGYTGTFSFGSQTLSVTGNADFRSGGLLTPASGTLAFTGAGAQTFIPKSGGTHPNITQNGAGGTTTVTTNALLAGNLTLTAGTFHLGTSLTHSVGNVSGSGALNFGTSNLAASGSVTLASATVTASSANTLSFTGGAGKTFTPNTSVTALNLTQNGAGATTVSANGFTTPLLTITAGFLDLGAAAKTSLANAIAFTGGGLGFGNCTLDVPAATVNLSGLDSIVNSSGRLRFTGSSAQSFTPKAGFMHPGIIQSGSGGTTLAANLSASSLSVISGAINLGTGRTHAIADIATSGGTLDFSSSTLNVTSGDAMLGGLSTLTAGTGTLGFTGSSGTRNLTPKSGQTHPAIVHTGTDTVRLVTNPLTCASFTQSAGAFQFNGLNVTTVSGGGFSVTNGNALSLAGLGGRTLTVAGNATFSGASSATRLNLNPPAAWTIAAAGTLNATFANLDSSVASVSVGSCTNCAFGAGNTNWSSSVTWDNGAGTASWKNPLNWGSDAVPGPNDLVIFNVTSADATLDSSVVVKGITFSGGYAGNFSFGTQTLSVTGNADFRSGGSVNAGTGTLAFTGTGAQTFIPKAGATFPGIVQNGNAGTTTVTTNALTAGDLTLSLGTFHLGTGLTHSVNSVSGAGGLHFGGSSLEARGSVNLASATVTASSANTLSFVTAASKTYTPNASVTGLKLTQNGAGTTTVATNAFSTSLLSIAAGQFNLGTGGLVHTASDIAFTGGGLGFAASDLAVAGATVDFSALDSVSGGTGHFRLTGVAAQTFTPKAGANHPELIQDGPGGTTLAGNVTAAKFTVVSGTLNLGAGRTHAAATLGGTGGTLNFNSSTLNLSGGADLSSLGTVTAGTGTLGFIAASDTQTFSPKAAQTHPAIVHSGASVLRLAANHLTCASFANSAGTLFLNGRNITTVSGGNFTISNGTSGTLAGLAGRTITVAGNASLNGASSGSRLNLNAASACTLAVTGTLSGSLATVAYSHATASSGSCSDCGNAGNNQGWAFAVGWDGGAGTTSWKNPLNWGSDYLPASGDDVTFSSGTQGATLDTSVTLKSITFSSGYTGAFSFGSQTLSVTGNADFRSGGAITAATGTLAFTGAAAQSFIPKASTPFPAIVQSGSGTTTVATNALSAASLALSAGTFHLGASLAHTVGGLSGSGALDFGTSNLSSTGDVDLSSLTVTAASANTLTFANSVARTFTPKASLTALNLSIAGSAPVTVSTNGFTVPTLAMAAGSLVLAPSLTHTVTGTLSLTGGGLDFNSGTLQISAATVDLRNLASLTGNGTLAMTGTAAQTLHPRASTPHPNLRQNGSGGTTLASNALQGGTLMIDAGTLDLGTGFTHNFAALTSSGGGLALGSSTLQIASGDANLSGLATLTPGTGTLQFAGPSGTQVLTPKASVNHPAVSHTAAGTLQLAANDLSCASFAQSAGALDLNGRNLTTVSGGNFTVTNGHAGSFVNLGGRTLTVAGNASLTGASGNLVNLDPATAWTLAVTGSLTATYASVARSTASATAGSAVNSSDGGSNSGWTFFVSWSGAGTDNLWSTAANWGSGAVPGASINVLFDATSVKNAQLAAAASVQSISFNSGYTGTFDFNGNTLTVAAGNADFRSGGGFTANGGALAFAGSGAQSLIPKAGSTFPDISKSGAGIVTVSTNALSAGNLSVTGGSFNLGVGLTHTVAAVSGSGTLDFGSSNLRATGNVDLSGLTVNVPGADTLTFLGAGAQTFTPKASVTGLALAQAGSGTTTVATNSFTAPSLIITAGSLDLGTGLSHTVSALNLTGGSLAFGSSTLRTGAATVNLSGLASLTGGTGTLELTASGPQAFTPKASTTHPILLKSGTGTATVTSNALQAAGINLAAGTLDLGTGFTHAINAVSSTGGTLTLNGSTVQISGNADLSGLATLNSGTGTLMFTAGTGTQTLTPKASVAHPAIQHVGAATLRLATNALSAASFAQSAGTLDLNGVNLSTTGNFSVTGGTPSSFAGLGGRTITVGGNVSIAGSLGQIVNLDPTTDWTLAATGSLAAAYSSVARCNASASAGAATSSFDGGGNTNWSFTVTWSGGGADNAWSTAGNWSSGGVPGATIGVIFDGTSTKNLILSADASAKSITMTTAYTGSFDFNGRTFTVHAGDADFRSGGAFSANGGTLVFAGTANRNFSPKAGAVFPAIVQNSAGTTAIANAALTAGDLTVSNGTLNLGAGFTHEVGAVSGSGTLDFGTSSLRASGNVNLSSLTVTLGGANTLAFSGTTTQTYTPKASVTALNLHQYGTGATTVSSTGFTTPSLTLTAGTLNLGTGLTHSVSTTLSAGGSLDFGSSILKVAAAAVDFTSIPALTAGTGTLEFTGSAAQTLTPKAGAAHPAILQSGTGGTTVATRDLTAGNLNITAGTWSLGTGFTHLFASLGGTGGGLAFGSSTLRTPGNANLSGLSTVTPGTGTLEFTAASGTQVLTPRSATTHPAISHSGAGTLQIATNALTAAAFTQTAGALDLNGQNVSTTGDFTVTGGTSASFNNLGGRTVTVGGNAAFTGQAGNLVNLNPATAWTLSVTGTLSATLAQIANNTASTTAGDATSSADGGGNVNWAFSVTWDGGGADNNWTTGANWSSDVVPAASNKVIFDATSVKNCTLDGAVSVKTLLFGTGYTGTFAFATNTLNLSGNADFRSGGAISAGTGTLAFVGPAAQSFIPKAGATFPALTQNGAGGTTIGTNALSAGALNVLNGTFSLGSGLTHNVASVGGTGGGIDFGASILKVAGHADLSGLATVNAGTGKLEFSGAGSQTFTPKSGVTHPLVAQTGTGATTISTNGLATAGIRLNAGTLNLGTGLIHVALDSLRAYAGTLDFGSSTLRTGDAAPSLAGLTALIPGTGTLEFNGASAQTFTGKAGATHPALVQSGAGGTSLANAVTAGNVTLANGTLNLGAGAHTFANLSATGGGLDFGSATLSVSGNVGLGGLGTLVAGTGTLAFTAASGTQVFTPKNGAVHPLLSHGAAGTLQLDANDLAARGLSQTGGTLDLNGRNLTLAGTGNLSVTGTGSALAGLAGRTLTVGGNAQFNGTPATKLDLNPASPWTLAVTGTLKAVNARIRNSTASISAGVADSSLDLGLNSGWTFLDTIKPDNVTGFLATANGGNSAALAWTSSVSADADSVMLRYRTDGTYPASRTDGTLWRSVAAAKSADTATGLADKTVYWFAAFVKDSSGNYSPASTAARDSARLPDVTPPANVTALVADGLTATTAALAWIPSGTADADSVMIRYRTGLVAPADPTDGTLWKKLRIAADKDTVTGLAGNTVYAFGLFVRDSSGNYSPATSAARDTSLFQLPVTGTLAVSDAGGFTRDGDPALAFTWSGADSLRFSLLADTASAAWKSVRAADSLGLGAADGRKIVAVQFKNVYGRRSPWYRDTTSVDRAAPAVTLDLKASHGRWTWPVAVAGKSRDSVSGTEMVFVVRRRLADNFHYNGSAWQAAADTAKLVLSATDTLFSASMPAASMTTGDYQFTAYARDRAGNVSAPIVQAVRYEENRIPALAYGNLPDTLLQNQTGAFKLDFGDLDPGDSLAPVSFDAPAWLTAASGPDTAWAPWALHKTYALSGRPVQAHVGANTVQVRLQDRGGLILTYTKSLFVVDVNDAPVFADSQATYSVKEDSLSKWAVKFKDEDSKDSHTLRILAGPAFAKVESLSVAFKPGSRDVGTHPLTLTVSDGRLLDTLQTALTVINVNDPPYAFPSDGWQNPFYFKEDRPDSFSVVVVDMDKNEPIVMASQLPAWIRMSTSVDTSGYNRTFRFRVNPVQKDTGSLALGMLFMDLAKASSSLALLAKVVSYNDTPVAAIEDPRTHAGAARFRLSVTDEDGSLEKARFHYRLVGPAGDTLRRGITPSPLLSLHPLADGDYRLAVRAEDQDGLQQPAFTVAAFSVSGATRLALDSARWHMIGPQQAALPASTFGPGANIASWDETTDDGQPMARYASGKTVETLRRGKGYWVKLPKPVALSAGQDDLMQGPHTLKLTRGKQGWNQVANPYPYWVDVSASRLTFWEWDADRRDLVNAKGLLKPWAAYWVLAPKDTTLHLADAPYFPPTAGPMAKSAAGGTVASTEALRAQSGPSAGFAHREQWAVQLALKAGPYHDEANLMGIRTAPVVEDMSLAAEASGAGLPGVAPLSLPDAPKFGDYIALHFEKGAQDGKDGAAHGYAADFRGKLDPEEEWWDFSVENSGSGETQALLTPTGLEALAAAGLKVFLVNQGEAALVEPGAPVALAMEEERTHYSLVVTPHADFASRLKGNFTISQNFPNPVHTFTTFKFFLPQSWGKDGKRVSKDFKLRINVYDYSGRQVAEAASGSFRPGSHTLLWKPVSKAGGPLAKGAYVYRLEVPGFTRSLKLLVE